MVSVQREKIGLTQRSAEEVKLDQETRAHGLSAVQAVPEGAGAMARLLARAGISADMFASVGDAAAASSSSSDSTSA